MNGIIELIVIAAALYMGISKQSLVKNNIAVLAMAAVFALIFILGPGDAQSGGFFSIFIGGLNWTFLIVVAALLFFIYRFDMQGKATKWLWIALAGYLAWSAYLAPGLIF